MCNCETLGAMEVPRTMTAAEITGFLVRHPIVATWIGETQTLINLGLYNFDYNPATDYLPPGVIRPWGIQVLGDSSFGNVVVFPNRTTRKFNYSAFTPVLGDINDPDFVSVTFPEGVAEFIRQTGASAASSLSNIVLIAAGIYAAIQLYKK